MEIPFFCLGNRTDKKGNCDSKRGIVQGGEKMLLLQSLLLAIMMYVIPTWVGVIFAGVDRHSKKLPFLWISGQFLLWAGFQFLCVPLIIKERSFREMEILFSVYILVLLSLATIVGIRQRKRSAAITIQGEKRSPAATLFWLLFWGLLLFQLVQAVEMAYADGDDAFYVAITTSIVDSDMMYRKIPYTGAFTKLDVRHGLAPFPVWIAYLSKISGSLPVSVSHIAVPLMLIPMTYAIYYLLAVRLFANRQESIPLFLVATELLTLFGDYSFYTVENFMLARSRQGKAALGSIVIPALFLLLLLLLEKLQLNRKLSWRYWILLTATMTTGCLCSTMGALLVCLLIALTGACAAWCYRKWTILLPLAASCIPCVVYALLYLLLNR